jgi:hypothetical protein
MIGDNLIQQTAEIIDDHFHNYENVFGVAAVPTATHFGDLEGLNPFHLVSGAAAFGAAVGLIGTADTPVRPEKILFDPRRVSITDTSSANPYILRIIWGTPAQTPAQAVIAKQYTDQVIQQQTANGQNKPQDIWCVRIPTGYQLWGEVKKGIT